MIKLPAILDSIRDLKDRSGKVAFVTREIDNQEFILLREHRGQEGHLLFSPNPIQDTDIPEDRAEMEGKTSSQRLRSVLFVLFKQEKRQEDFETFYRQTMEKLIQRVKNTLN